MKSNTLNFKMLFLILAVSFSSCDKMENSSFNNDDEDIPTNYTLEKFKLVKVLKYSNSTATQLTGETVCTYDKAGNRIKESFYEFYYDPPTTVFWMYKEYEYSGNKKIKMKIFDGQAGNPTLGSYYIYSYKGDLLAKEETYDGRTNSLITSINNEYDGKGNLVKTDTYDHLYNRSFGGLKYIYDNQNRLTTVLTTDGVLDYYPCQKYQFDSNGRVVKLEYYEFEGLSSYVEKIYNGSSRLPEKEFFYDKNGNQNRKLTHYYDEWNNLTETVINDECSMFKRKYNGKLLIEEILYWAHEYGYFGTGQMPENGMSRYEYEEF